MSRMRSGSDARKRRLSLHLCLLVAFGSPVACQSSPPAEEVRKAAAAEAASRAEFSGDAAWQHLRALNAAGLRLAGSNASARAREHLKESLSRADVSSRELRLVTTTPTGAVHDFNHVLASVPGRSKDVILLAAHYDLPAQEAAGAVRAPGPEDQRASGAALLLELARAAKAGPPPEYTLWLAFIDGDSGAPEARPGTRSLVEAWSNSGELERIRTAVFFGEVGDGRLPMLRDIDSPRFYRELFWESARGTGHGEIFPVSSPYGRADTGRTVFAELTRRSSVALQSADSPIAAPSPPPASAVRAAPPAPPRLSAGIEAVGRVTLATLQRVAAKLRRIDRFAQAPLKAGRDPVEPPASQP